MKKPQQLSVAIGCFDGLHIGHEQVIKSAVEKKSDDTAVAVITFDLNTPKLMSEQDKREEIYSLGVDEIISFKLSEIKHFSPEQFVRDILKARLNVKYISVGFNFRFGRNASGDVNLLQALCRRAGISVSVIPPVKLSGKTVSSTAIREMLTVGNVSGAEKMLGRPFKFTAKVVHGAGRGERELGIPTINQKVGEDIFAPKFGVYRSRVTVKGESLNSVTNVGIRPTVSGKDINYETHIFDSHNDLYGETVSVELLEFIRNEKKFETLSELKTQMEADIATVKRKNSLHLK